jgi:hypothetical protein
METTSKSGFLDEICEKLQVSSKNITFFLFPLAFFRKIYYIYILNMQKIAFKGIRQAYKGVAHSVFAIAFFAPPPPYI